MQDWVLVSAPFAATFYFIVYPSQFMELLAWVGAVFN